MKKIAAHLALLIPLVVSPFSLAQAQTLTAATQELTPISITTAAIPSLTDSLVTATPLTAEAPPVPAQPAGTAAGAQTDTRPTEAAADTTDKTTTESDPSSSTEESGENIIYPDAEIPVLDLESSDGQTQESSGLVIPSASDCLDPATAEAAILPSVTANQIRISLLVFLGSIMGSLLFVLSNFLINSARGQREILKLERQTRLQNQACKLEILANAHKNISETLPLLFRTSGNRLILDAKALADYRTAAVNIEMFGSNKSLEAHQKLSSLLSQAKLPSLEEIESAKTDLIAALQQDLGLNQLK